MIIIKKNAQMSIHMRSTLIKLGTGVRQTRIKFTWGKYYIKNTIIKDGTIQLFWFRSEREVTGDGDEVMIREWRMYIIMRQRHEEQPCTCYWKLARDRTLARDDDDADTRKQTKTPVARIRTFYRRTPRLALTDTPFSFRPVRRQPYCTRFRIHGRSKIFF